MGAPLGPVRELILDCLRQQMKEIGWAAPPTECFLPGLEASESASVRIKGYLGWLLTEPQYALDEQLPRDRWMRFPANSLPSFPLGRPHRLPQSGIIGVPAEEFGEDLVNFLDKWSLRHLAWWGLPVPPRGR
jgi:hypothetical protein